MFSKGEQNEMTILTAHVGVQKLVGWNNDQPLFRVSMRRLASITGKFGVIDLLVNRDHVQSDDWNWSLSFGSLTLAFVSRN
jgi:hypothetical protein